MSYHACLSAFCYLLHLLPEVSGIPAWNHLSTRSTPYLHNSCLDHMHVLYVQPWRIHPYLRLLSTPGTIGCTQWHTMHFERLGMPSLPTPSTWLTDLETMYSVTVPRISLTRRTSRIVVPAHIMRRPLTVGESDRGWIENCMKWWLYFLVILARILLLNTSMNFFKIWLPLFCNCQECAIVRRVRFRVWFCVIQQKLV